jgi:histidinol phosphatase-like PHP family hydrolase
LIDLHTHSFFSDGVLVPSELLRWAEDKGIEALAITDHVDASNIDFVVPRLVQVCQDVAPHLALRPIPGAEITHAPPATIAGLAKRARELGARIVTVHGETIVEPVRQGTNRAALMSEIDFLAHPGLITLEEVKLALERGILLEITSRRGHSLTNGHVAQLAREAGAGLIVNTDTHEPGDLLDDPSAREVAFGAGLSEAEAAAAWVRSKDLVARAHP